MGGTLDAPPSKSLTQRAIAAGLLAGGTTVIRHPSYCNDSVAAMGIARALGANVTEENDRITVTPGDIPAGPVSIDCGESGLALRMFAPVAALMSESVSVTGEGSLIRRPVTMISEALSQLGVRVETAGGLLPVQLSGRLRSGRALVDGSTGSQLLTGLLMALPLAKGESRLDVANLTSKPYIGLTLGLLADFGITVINDKFMTFTIPGNQVYKAREYSVEGDWSGASFLLVAGATGGGVTVKNLGAGSMQADRAVMRALEDAGAVIEVADDSIKVSGAELRAFSFDATDSPDLFPPLAALAASCEGASTISGVGRLRHKESDRAEAIADVLGAMGIGVRISGDAMVITGGQAKGAVVSSHNDHRIAMMAAVMAASAAGPVTITGAEAVAKSYPGFFDDLTRLGARVS
ncbi:3-phosphoshikimate 1-carboxyvinyltransferase [bacterium]|nr:3-phosphoshikimate 1-carboxyvinyltransferase [bacterium]